MRLWSLHPRHLDPQGLVALWREGLLARAVLHEETRGYRNHPQLDRFKAHTQPKRAIDAYLVVVQDEATARGYRFDRSKLGRIHRVASIAVERGQLEHERAHLLGKLLKTFGEDRVLFGGDWPVCLLGGSYRRWVESLAAIVCDRPDPFRKKLFHDNAARVYRVS